MAESDAEKQVAEGKEKLLPASGQSSLNFV